jgi:hypothetical protein
MQDGLVNEQLSFGAIFTTMMEAGPSGNIWIVKLVGNEWTEPKNLEQPFCDSEISGVTHDEKYLFITNEKRKAGNDDIYWVEIRCIDLLKPGELKLKRLRGVLYHNNTVTFIAKNFEMP